MNPAPANSAVAEINRLHEQAKSCAFQSRQTLMGALAAAWQAGQLLTAEKKRVLHSMGPGAWLLWLEANFKGTARTAQRYMRLTQCVTDPAFLQGMSLRQAYARLGIATEPKTPGKRRPGQTDEEQGEAYRRDLRLLYEKLRRWFESTPPASNFSTPERSHKL